MSSFISDNNDYGATRSRFSHSVANATHLDAKMVSIRNGMLGNEPVGCMRKCGNRGQMHGPEHC
ncbi:hypothetical protein F6Y02_05835 (plasmid) [Bacillus megaterium]|nr:hypothetical protein [Priestia megaterium]